MLLNAAEERTARRDPAWRGRLNAAALFLVVTVPAGLMAEFNPLALMSDAGLGASRSFMATFFPPAHSRDFLELMLASAWKTVAIATAGVMLALALAIPLAIAAARTLSLSLLGRNRMPLVPNMGRTLIRWLLLLLRSIPELVWGLVFVRAVGLGDTAGVLAIALAYSGMIGKVFLEIFESQDARASEALLANGAGRLSAFSYGTLASCLPELVSYTVYRWECAMRSSVILGFVGAGGIGQQMELSLRMLAGDEVLSLLLAFMALVWIADFASARMRRWIE